jgi:hypothetical protein
MKYLFLLSLVITKTLHAELYDGAGHPANFSSMAGMNVLTRFSLLPKSGKLSDDRLGWSESYWPSNKGGVAYRWNHPDPRPFNYRLHTLEELRRMSEEEIEQLSPAELYDISNDDYNYSLTRKVLGLHSPRDLWWEGICHGWAQAAINFPEPMPIIYTNRERIRVPIGASDIKALLAMHEAYNFRGEVFAFAGRRCKVRGKVVGEADERDNPSDRQYPSEELANSFDCRDVNAGAFHVIISNMIGFHGKGFVADIDRFNDVWNQPVVSYSSKEISEEDVPLLLQRRGVSRRVRIKLTMTYGEELKFYTPELAAQGLTNFVSKLPVTKTPHQKFLSRDYEYIVEINGTGDVIGGEWITQTRPDFIWHYARSKIFKNAPMPLAHLKNIYRPLRRQNLTP